MRPRRSLGLSAALALLAAGCATEDPASPSHALRTASLPLVEVSPEQDLDPPVLGSAWGAQGSAQVAFDGTQYLVVWEDRRSAFDARIFAARVDTDGVVLDKHGIEIGHGAEPAVATGGGVFLVVYQTSAWPHEGSGASLDSPSDVRATRIDAQGTVLDGGGGFAISAGAQWELRPSVAFDGQRFLAAWDDNRNGSGFLDYDVYHARVSPAGTVLDAGGVLTALNPGAGALDPAVAASDQGFLVAWAGPRAHGTRVDGQGVTLDPAGIPIGPAVAQGERHADLTATFDGANYVVTWIRTDGSFSVNELQAGRVSPQGAALDAAPILVAPDSGIYLSGASAAADGMGTVVLWRSGFTGTDNSVRWARLDPQGVVQPPGGLVLATSAYAPAVGAAADGSALAVWTDSSSDLDAVVNPRLAGARIDAQGTVIDNPSVTVATSANTEQSPAVAFDGERFVVVWADDRGYDVSEGRQDIHGVRVDPGGAAVDPTAIPIGTGPGHQFLPAAVHTGQITMVAWADLLGFDSDDEDFPGLRLARVSDQGVVLDPVPLLPGAIVYERPSAASNGAGAVLGIRGYDTVSVLPVDATGAPGTEWFPPPADPSVFVNERIAVACDGIGYLAVAPESGPSGAMHGWLLDAQGAFTGVGPFPISPQGLEAKPEAAAFNGTDYVVLWTSAEGLLGTRVTPAGVVLDPQGFLIAPGVSGYEAAAELVCEGARCIAAFRQRAVADDPTSLDIVGAELSPQGGVASTFTISAEPGAEGPPTLAAGAGHIAVAYSRMRSGAPFASVRAQLRWLVPIGGEGGAGGAGGAPGTGGMGGQAVGGAGGDGGAPEDPEDGGGCDCATAPSGAPAAPSWMAVLGLGLWRLRRAARRRRAGPSRS